MTHSYDVCRDITQSKNTFSTTMPGATIAITSASRVTMSQSHDVCRDMRMMCVATWLIHII